ncbi:MAG TPA: hypothetical protein VEO53_13995 [Candidatus Binatia bacterium]|nr:hypothetical protein [Candidatus Binatia bacterium]
MALTAAPAVREPSLAPRVPLLLLAHLLHMPLRMRFALEIGETEKNRLEFQFNQLLGSTVIKVNDQEVKKNVRLFSEPLREAHELEVGKNERHTVFIEKQRKLLFGQKYLVYVNQRLVKLLHGI